MALELREARYYKGVCPTYGHLRKWGQAVSGMNILVHAKVVGEVGMA